LGISELVSQLIIASLVEYGRFEFSIPELDQTSCQVHAIGISLVDMPESVMVQIRLSIGDSSLLPDDESLTPIIGLS
jgi:hypothetical protein